MLWTHPSPWKLERDITIYITSIHTTWYTPRQKHPFTSSHACESECLKHCQIQFSFSLLIIWYLNTFLISIWFTRMPEQIHPLLGSKTSTMTRLATSICSHAYTNRSQTLMAMKRPKTEPKWLKGEQEEARNRDRQKDIKKEKNKENKRVGRKLLPFISRWSPLLPSCRRRRWWRRWKWRRRRRGRRASRTRSSSLS